MENISVILLLLHECNSALSSLSPFPVLVASNHLLCCETERSVFAVGAFFMFNQLRKISVAMEAFRGKVARSLVPDALDPQVLF